MRAWLALIAPLLLVACAHPWYAVDLPVGTPRDQVLAKAGPPYRMLPLPGGGQRLQYTTQPLGRYAFMVDLDAAGRLVSARQVLTAADFARLQIGQWTQADVEREFGPPAMIDSVSSWNGPILTYRWIEAGTDMFYWFYLDPQGVVRRAHPGLDLTNTPNDRDAK